jgi:O-antigen ligase
MLTQELISGSIYMLFALLLAVVAVLSLGLLSHVGRWYPRGWFPFLFPLIVFGFGASTLLSGRSLSDLNLLFSGSAEEQGTAIATWLNRLISLSALAICIERISRYAFVPASRFAGGWHLFWAFVAFAVGNVLLNGLFGTRPDLTHRYVYPIIAILAAFLFAQNDTVRSVRLARTALLVLLVASAAMVAIKPTLVFQPNYTGLIPGLRYRYWGLSPNANSLGPLAVVFLLCLWTEPFPSRWLNRCSWMLGLASLLLSQSKTSYLVFIVSMSILIAVRVRPLLTASLKQGSPYVLVIIVSMAMITTTALGFSLMFVDVLRPIERFMATHAGGELLSLTGRDVIWNIAIGEWTRNFWFGYGPAMWDLAYRMQIGLIYAFHAHNQFFQSLGGGGVIGAGTLVVYVIALVVSAFKASIPSRGLSLALISLLLLRSVTEAPFVLGGFGGAEFLVHLLTFTVCAGYSRETNPARASRRSMNAFSRATIAPSKRPIVL